MSVQFNSLSNVGHTIVNMPPELWVPEGDSKKSLLKKVTATAHSALSALTKVFGYGAMAYKAGRTVAPNLPPVEDIVDPAKLKVITNSTGLVADSLSPKVLDSKGLVDYANKATQLLTFFAKPIVEEVGKDSLFATVLDYAPTIFGVASTALSLYEPTKTFISDLGEISSIAVGGI